jgi:thiosulfate/3-mercaptopyruvate sulfurtransferase
MIHTLFGLDALGTSLAAFLALLVGFGFGFALERAGFSSSRRLAGVFYFTDMAVIKVMFSALITALLGLSYMTLMGWVAWDQIFHMPTIYGAQIAGGVLFGIGFAMGAWCPGTAAAGLAAGRVDALIFLLGALGGSILFNETFPWVSRLYTLGDQGIRLLPDDLGLPRHTVVLAFTAAAVVMFWLCELAEKARTGRAPYLGSRFLMVFSLVLLLAGVGLFALPQGGGTGAAPGAGAVAEESALLAAVDDALDHLEPEELADRLLAGEPGLLVADVRTAEEYAAFHIRGAIHVPLAEAPRLLEPHRNRGTIVLYSNGMTHPAQARDALHRLGFRNVLILTDGLAGFRERCLKPVSLRSEPLPPAAAGRIQAWRAFFETGPSEPATPPPTRPRADIQPRLIDPDWLAARLGAAGIRVLDLRPQPEYNTAHIPGALSLNVESLRGNRGGVPSLLLPSPLLAAHLSWMGVQPSDTLVIVPGDRPHDATLAALALERLGHLDYAILNGGHSRWIQEGRPTDTALPAIPPSAYPVPPASDRFTADYQAVAAGVGKPGVVILDVRPADFYSGKKSDEARAGHIPGALNRPYTEDVVTASNKVVTFKSTADLAAAYAELIPARDADIIVHCRTGHQASQTYFVLTRLLGYPNVRWYDAGWTEWAARPELPVAVPTAPDGR